MLVNQCWHSLTPMVPVDEILYTQRGISPHFRTDPRPFAVLFEGLNTWQVHREEPASDHESVEHEEATDRFYSQDDIKRALAILNLESLPTEPACQSQPASQSQLLAFIFVACYHFCMRKVKVFYNLLLSQIPNPKSKILNPKWKIPNPISNI